jgi:hypothetical protein
MAEGTKINPLSVDGCHLEVSETGKTIRNRWTLRLLKPIKDKVGYYRIWATRPDRSRRTFLVHRLVALTYLECPEGYEKLDINHKDGDKSNNHFTNLEWCTAKENTKHAIINGLWNPKTALKYPKTERNEAIVKMRKETGLSYKKIGEEFDISSVRAREICKMHE